jgi:hypothetical protein
MNDQSPEVYIYTLAIVGGFYFLFGYLINFKYIVSGALSYTSYRELIILYDEYSWMLDSSNQEKLIFGGAVVATGLVSTLLVNYLFLNPLVPWYRKSVFNAKQRKIWNPLILASIWVLEAVLVHYIGYTSILSDKVLSSYPQDYLLGYYMIGIGGLLAISAIFHSKNLLTNVIKLVSDSVKNILKWIKKINRFVKVEYKTSRESRLNQATSSLEPTIMETTKLAGGHGQKNPLEDEQDELLYITDGDYHYKKMKVISRGGFGVVYLVKNMKSNVLYAAKCPHLPFSSVAEMKRFQIEVDSQSSIRHQNVAKIIHTCRQEDFVYIIMEYVEGSDLRKSIIEKKYNNLPSKLNLIYQILHGLTYIHSNHIIHRDIKPNNILISTDGIAKITDFGIAKDLNSTQITVTGSIMGTPEYMSPEQHQGLKVDLRTDIYSVGLTFYQLLAGNQLYPPGCSITDIYNFKKTHSFTPLYQIDNTIKVKLSETIHRAFSFDREDRYESAMEFWEAISNSI